MLCSDVQNKKDVADTPYKHADADTDEGQASLLVVEAVISAKDERPRLESKVQDAKKKRGPVNHSQYFLHAESRF